MVKRFAVSLALILWATAASAGDYDSLASYRALARAATNYNSTVLTDSDLDYLTNMAAGFVQVDLKSKVTRQAIKMTANTLEYDICSTAIGGTLVMLIWKTYEMGKEKALAPLPPDLIGKVLSNSGPFYYVMAGRTLIIHNNSVADDSLIAFYIPMATRMKDTTDAAGIDETDALAVAYLTASFINANRKDYQNAAFWWAVYRGYKNAKLGVVNAPQD